MGVCDHRRRFRTSISTNQTQRRRRVLRNRPAAIGDYGMKRYLLVLSILGVATSFAADPPTVQIIVPNTTPPAIQVGAAPRPFQITVANDLPGDMPTVTSFTLNGVDCT